MYGQTGCHHHTNLVFSLTEFKRPYIFSTMLDPKNEDKGSGEDKTTQNYQMILKGLVILPPRQKSPSAAIEKHSVALPTLRADEPIQLLRNALSEVIGYAQLTSYRFEIREKPKFETKGEADDMLVSPYTGKDAVISVPVGLRSVEQDNYYAHKNDKNVLGYFRSLSRLTEDDWYEKEVGLEIVLERYDLAGIKEHVDHLTSLLNGNAPSIYSLNDDEEEANTKSKGGEDKGKPSSSAPVLPSVNMKQFENKATDGSPNLGDFFYRTNGYLPEDFNPENGGDRCDELKNGDHKKKKKSKGLKGSSSNQEKSHGEFATYVDHMAQLNRLEQLCKVPCSIRYSGFHPPPTSRRCMGDLAYLECSMDSQNGSGTTLHVTANTAGFYINKSTFVTGRASFDPSPSARPCFSHCLLDCLLEASEVFCNAWKEAVESSKERARVLHFLESHSIPSFFRIATRGDFPGFESAAFAATSVQRSLDEYLATPTWLVPRPRLIPRNENTSWSGNHFHPYNNKKNHDEPVGSFGADFMNGGTRDWNEELQTAREMPTNTREERVERARLMHKTLTEFGEASLLGVKGICEGTIQPMNPNEYSRWQVYVHNNVFFSLAVDAGPESFKLTQGDRAAKKAVNRDIQCVGTLHRSEKAGLYTLATVLIDYLGNRFLCQSVLPGILCGEKAHTVLYGSVDASIPLRSDTEFCNILKEKIGGPMMVASRPVLRYPLTAARVEEIQQFKKDSPVFLSGVETRQPSKSDKEVEPNATFDSCIPIEAKGIMGSDQRKYLLEFGRLTPRDANWVPKSKGGTGNFEGDPQTNNGHKSRIPTDLEDPEWVVAVLRPELISRYTQLKMTQFASSKKESKSNDQKVETTTANDNNGHPDDKTISASVDNEGRGSIEEPSNTQGERTEMDSLGLKNQLDEEDLEYLETLKVNVNVFLPDMRSLEGIDDSAYALIKDDEQRARDVANYLWNDVLPSITRAVKDGSVPVPMDGKALTAFLHRTGVNCRYLGRLAQLAREEEIKDENTEVALKKGKPTILERRVMSRCWLEILECEIVARAAKHVLDSYYMGNGAIASTQPSQTVAAFLSALVSEYEETAAQTEIRTDKARSTNPTSDDFNALTIQDIGENGSDTSSFGRNDVWSEIEAEIGRRFRYTLSIYNTRNKAERALYIPLLRRVCQRTGVRLFTRDYNVGGPCVCTVTSTVTESYPISALDIVEILPLMKHAAAYSEGFTPCSFGPSVALPALQVSLKDASSTLERAHIQASARALGKSLELAQEAVALYQKVTGNEAHPGIVEGLELMSSIFLDAGDPVTAAINSSKALTLAIQDGGYDTPNAFSAHMSLFQMYFATRQLDRSISHLLAAIYILEVMVGPRHAESFSAYQKLGSIYSHDDYKGKYLSTAARFLEETTTRNSSDRLMNGITEKTRAKVLADIGQFKEASEIEARALQSLSAFLGKDHQLTKESESDLMTYTQKATVKGDKLVDSKTIREQELKADAVAAALAAEEEAKSKFKKKQQHQSPKRKGKK